MEPPPALHTPLTDPLLIAAWAAIGVLLLGSAAMSAAEVALFSLNPPQLRDLRERGGRSGARVLDLLSRPRRLLATILITNTFVNMGVVVLSAVVIQGLLDAGGGAPWLTLGIHVLGVALAILLLGEMLPKAFAAGHALGVATVLAGPLAALRWLLTPVNELLVRASTLLERRYRRKPSKGLSVDSLGQALELAPAASTTDEERRILKGIVKFGRVEVREVMRPRTAMVAFDKALRFPDLVTAIIGSGFSRVPVYEGTLDHVIGVLHIKDVLPYLDKPDMDWLAHLREPCFVPETKKLDDMLKEFQRQKMHLAIVVDEYGGTSGLVTLEDVLEEIVGDITDEFDDEELTYTKLDDRTWVFEGRTPLNDLYRIMGIDGSLFEEHRGDSGTVGGFVLELTGRIPLKGERVSLRNLTFVVESSDNKRVRRVKISVGDEGAA